MAKNVYSVLDFGSSRISLVVGAAGLGDAMLIKNISQTEYAGFYDGEFLEPKELQKAIALCISNAQIATKQKIRKLYVGLPAEFCFIRTVNGGFSLDKRRRITDYDLFQLHYKYNELKANKDYTLLTVNAENYFLDNGKIVNQPIGEKAESVNVNLSYCYVETSLITKLNGIFKDLAFESVEYLPSFLYEALYLLEEDQREKSVALIDCGYITTSISIVRGDALQTMSSLPLGGGHITADISQCFDISYADAERLHKQMALTVKFGANDNYEIASSKLSVNALKANEVAVARIQQIANCCKKLLEKQEDFKYLPICLTGGGLYMAKGAKEIFAKELGKPVSDVLPKQPLMEKPYYSSALGLLSGVIKSQQKNTARFLAKLFKK